MDIFNRFGLWDNWGRCTEEGAWIEVHGMAFSHVRFSVFLSTTSGSGWPARSSTVSHGSASYGESIEVLNGPVGCGPWVDTYARIRLIIVGLRLGAAPKRNLEKVGCLYILVFAHYSKVEAGSSKERRPSHSSIMSYLMYYNGAMS